MSLADAGSVVLVGAGKMGMALARGWLKASLKPAQLVLVDPQPSDSTVDFAGEHGVRLELQFAEKDARVIVLAVKPQVMAGVLEALKPKLTSDMLVLSIAAGITLDRLSGGLGSDRIVRTMPNTPAQVGRGVTGAFAARGVTKGDRELAELLLTAAGDVVWVEAERDLDVVTAVSGSGPAYVFLLVEAMAAAGVAEGLSQDQATRLARKTVTGAAALLEADPADAATLRQNVTSPGGTTAAALDVLMAGGGLPDVMAEAIRAARKRSEELGR